MYFRLGGQSVAPIVLLTTSDIKSGAGNWIQGPLDYELLPKPCIWWTIISNFGPARRPNMPKWKTCQYCVWSTQCSTHTEPQTYMPWPPLCQGCANNNASSKYPSVNRVKKDNTWCRLTDNSLLNSTCWFITQCTTLTCTSWKNFNSVNKT